jgi:hypothetical protein
LCWGCRQQQEQGSKYDHSCWCHHGKNLRLLHNACGTKCSHAAVSLYCVICHISQKWLPAAGSIAAACCCAHWLPSFAGPSHAGCMHTTGLLVGKHSVGQTLGKRLGPAWHLHVAVRIDSHHPGIDVLSQCQLMRPAGCMHFTAALHRSSSALQQQCCSPARLFLPEVRMACRRVSWGLSQQLSHSRCCGPQALTAQP